jgi:hypothetical protein
MISPHFTDSKLQDPSVDDLIDVFEDRMKYWLFEPAKSLFNDAYGQVAGFCLLLTYFEGIYSYVQGKSSKGQSTAFFKNAFLEVFRTSGLNETLLTRIAEILYKDARCGFFHDGMFRERIYLKSLKKGELLVTLPKKMDI